MRILISGASGGLGKELIKDFIKRDFELILIAKSNSKELESMLESLKVDKDKITILTLDLTEESSWDVLQSKNLEVDALINLIGISSSSVSWKITSEEWRRVFQVNTEIPFRLSQLVIPEMRKNGFGRILFFSSIVAEKGVFGTAAYASSKSALHGLTRTMSQELIQSGVTVNCVAPGYMNKGMIDELSDEFRNQILESIPTKSLGDTQNIVNTVNYLLDKNSNYITGQIISVNGGLK